MGGRMGGQIRNKPQTLMVGEVRGHAPKSYSHDDEVINDDDFDSIGEEQIQANRLEVEDSYVASIGETSMNEGEISI